MPGRTLPALRIVLLGACALGTCAASLADAAPFLPEHDTVVLETLPASTECLELRVLRAQLAETPDDLDLALTLASKYLAAGRADADPRHAGWAEGVLAPWSRLAQPPVRVLLLRATLRQNRHDFAGALADLARVLAREPRNADAWLTTSAVLSAQGEPAAAARACRPLLASADALVAASCFAAAGGGRAESERSLAWLEAALTSAAGAPAELRRFAYTVLAEQAARLGREALAESAFAAALAIGRPGAYLLAARADHLLDRGRPSEAIDLLGPEPRADGLLLRVALAEQQLGAAALASHVAALRARFAASHARGESLHLGEEARFELAFGDARHALALAARNFAVQREPRDARVVLEAALATSAREAALATSAREAALATSAREAALATGEAAAARPVLDWLAETQLADVTLAALTARLEGRN
jgi:hypothetical protein